MQKDLCQIKDCSNYGKYWRYCGHANGQLNKPKPISPRSKKLEKVMKNDYRPQVKEMIEAGAKCKVNSPVCTGKAQGFHHLQGRIGKLLTDTKKKISCCNACNQFIEQNDAWARANGFKLSKFSEPVNKN